MDDSDRRKAGQIGTGIQRNKGVPRQTREQTLVHIFWQSCLLVCIVVSILIAIIFDNQKQQEKLDKINQSRINRLIEKVESAEQSAKKMIDALNKGYEGK